LVVSQEPAPVTLENVQGFVRRLCCNQYIKPRAKALDWIKQGFSRHSMHLPTLNSFTRQELRDMYSGNETVSEADFIECLSFEDAENFQWGSEEMTATRGYLLQAVKDEAFRKRLLHWSTGYNAIPFAATRKFAIKVKPGISLNDNTVSILPDGLPEASTCINELRLPCYSSLAKLRERMDMAMAVLSFNEQ
ncbi:hypothetical protein JKP88DRAFT_146954, partial [Tribonema minus]